MTETEKRRSELLAQTRARYSDRYTPPAVHPRYQNAYKSLYSDTSKTGTFGIRVFVAAVLFCLYALAHHQNMQEADMVSQEIVRDYTSFVDFTFLH